MLGETSSSLFLLHPTVTATYAYYASYPTLDIPTDMTFGLLNNDAFPDLIVAAYPADSVSVYFGNGVGGFGSRVDLKRTSLPGAIAAGDFNEDGFADIVICNGAGTFSLLVSKEKSPLGGCLHSSESSSSSSFPSGIVGFSFGSIDDAAVAHGRLEAASDESEEDEAPLAFCVQLVEDSTNKSFTTIITRLNSGIR